MTSNFAARPATSGELVKQRSDNQATRLGLAIQHPVTVYTAHINQDFETVDGIAELIYDGGVGTLANVLPNMTLYVSTSAGVGKGVCRVRKTPTSDRLYINQSSDIQFANDDILTVVNSFGLWQRDLTVTGGVVRMDYDLDFGTVTSGGVIPRIAPLVAVLHLSDGVDGAVEFSPPDPTLSACYDGANIVSFLYSAPGAVSTANMDTDHPSWSYSSSGEYRWSCTITDDLGRETVSHRWVFVDPARIPFKMESNPTGDYGEGGWSFAVTCLADVARSQVYDRALCTLYATDYYGGVKGSVGKIAGYENVICSGWIDGESIVYDSESGEVTFTVQGAAYWLKKIRAFPFELQYTSGAPINWKQLQGMTVGKALAHLLSWTTTAPTVMDCFLTDSPARWKIFAEPSGSLLDQMTKMAGKVFSTALVNSYGQLFVEVDSQIISDTERATLPVIMDITKIDRIDGLEIVRNTSEKTSLVELSAASDYDGVASTQIYSRAPGTIGKKYGEPGTYDDYAIVDQSDCNRIAGRLLAVSNPDYEPLDIELSANSRLIDIAPRQYCTLSVSAEDNPRGVAFTSAKLIPRRIEYMFDEDNASITTQITFEFEVTSIDGVTYIPPPVVQTNLTDGFGDAGFDDFPLDNTWFPPVIPAPLPTGTCTSETENRYTAYWDRPTITDSIQTARCYFPCKLHGGVDAARSRVSGIDGVSYTIYAMVGDSRVATANAGGVFNLPSELDVDGFEIEVLTTVFYKIGAAIASGTVLGTNGEGVNVPVTEGNYYSIEGTGGPWYYKSDQPEWKFYNFWSGAGGYLQDEHGAGWSGTAVNPIGGFGYMSLQMPYGCLLIEPLGDLYARVYFQANESGFFNFVCSDFIFGDNGGSLGYILRPVTVLDEPIALGMAAILNVCPVGE